MTPAYAQFLKAQGIDPADIQPLASDASPRQYARVRGAGRLIMSDPTDPVGFDAFVRLSGHLTGLGLSVPQVFATDPDNGLALIEDFGDTTYAAELAAGAGEEGLYQLAVETLAHLHNAPSATDVAQPAYSHDTYLDELRLFTDWFAPAVAHDLPADFTETHLTLWDSALTQVSDRRDTLVLKDFHVDNLMVLNTRSGVARCGLLDFQDALVGPCEYDLVSLLQDARRDLAPGLEARMLDLYCSLAPTHLGGSTAIRRRYAMLGAQRHARILGVFVRLARRDQKPRYLAFMDRVAQQFEQALQVAELTEILEHLTLNIPDWRRKVQELSD